MGKAYKNFWSLNTDEAIVAGILRNETAKGIEVLMPLNAQEKDVDLVLINPDKRKFLTIQVKGSRAFEPRKIETKKYGDGSAGWFYFPAKVIQKSTADYFIFLVYILEHSHKLGRRFIKHHTITIPTGTLKKLVKKSKKTHGGGKYSFLIWINHTTKKAFDFRDKLYYLSEFLDKEGLKKINSKLK